MADPRKLRFAQISLSLACIIAILVCLYLLSTQDLTGSDDHPTRDLLFKLMQGPSLAFGATWIAPPIMLMINRLKKGTETIDEDDEDDPEEECLVCYEKRSKIYVLIVGDQFVGKTQLIRTLCGDFTQVDPEDRTGDGDESEHRLVEGPVFGGAQLMFIDHRGQDFSSIVEAFEGPRLATVSISSIVFMTDLFGFPEREGRANAEWKQVLDDNVHRQEDTADAARVNHHRQQLSKATLDFIFRILKFAPDDPNRLRSLFVFVNKIDKLNNWPRDLTSEEYKAHIEPILLELQARAQRIKTQYNSEVKVNWTAGSALHGWGIAGKDRLLDTLIPNTKDKL